MYKSIQVIKLSSYRDRKGEEKLNIICHTSCYLFQKTTVNNLIVMGWFVTTCGILPKSTEK